MTPTDKSSLASLAHFTTTKLALDVAIDFARRRVCGSVALSMRRLPSHSPIVSQLVLDTRALAVHRVAIDGTTAQFALDPTTTATSPLGTALRITLPTSTANRTDFTVTVDYETTEACTAVQWLAPQQTAGKKHPYMFTQCQAIHARSLLPCMDSPSVKAPYSARVTVAKPLVALMSAINRATKPPASTTLPDGTEAHTFVFDQPQPVPSYLIALAAGNLVSADIGPRSKVWTEPEMLDDCVWEFEGTDKFISAAEKFLPTYCWSVYDLLVLPGSFPYGGMENPCLTFVTPTLLAGDRTLVDVVAHEIAHSWCGNLVTSSDWESFWLNEGWTVYVERLILRELHGNDHRLFSATIGWRALQDSIETFGKTNPLTALVPDLSGIDPDDSFSSVPYEKGFNLLYHLETLIGFDKFVAFMKDYVETYANKSIATRDFLEKLQSHFKSDPEVVAKLDKINWHAWFHSPGMPPLPTGNAVPFDSALVIDVQKLVEQWDSKTVRDLCTDNTPIDSINFPYNLKTGVDKFSSGQKVVFLERLTELSTPLSTTALLAMDKLYGFTAVRNSEVLFRWLMLLLHSQNEAHYGSKVDVMKQFLARQGRMKYTRPLYRAWYKAELANMGKEGEKSGKNFRSRIYFQQIRETYHPICAALVAKDLGLVN